jgi:hypothetical protein
MPAWRGESNGGYSALGDFHVALNDPAVNECSFDSESHVAILAGDRL